MNFQQKLNKIIKKNNSLLCIGLDPVLEKLPKRFQKKKFPFFAFNKTIIDATHDLVCCYKPNSAFYEALGEKGIGELKKTCDYLQKNYPDIFIILDAKRGDIESTNEGYVQFAYDYLHADAITLHPYLGKEALQPFLQRKDKASIILCHTTNSGAQEIQDIQAGKEPFYKIIAKKVVQQWNIYNNCMMVLGAGYPDQLKEVRRLAGDMTFLVPGVGTQGADLVKTMKAGLNSKKMGMIINSSRGIIFAKNPRLEAQALRDTINTYRV